MAALFVLVWPVGAAPVGDADALGEGCIVGVLPTNTTAMAGPGTSTLQPEEQLIVLSGTALLAVASTATPSPTPA